MKDTQKKLPSEELYIGLMSGTSADGIDASVISTDGKSYYRAIDNIHLPYPNELRSDIKSLYAKSSNNFPKLDHLLEVEKTLTNYHAEIVKNILTENQIPSKSIKAIGFHGQTIYHAPEKQITHQIGNPHKLARMTGIDVIYDFRKMDVELGGQGAPLIPIFHRCLSFCYKLPVPVVLINIGGVANLTYINEESYADESKLIAFDTGPGNALIDELTEKFFNKKFDHNGEIANSGTPYKELVETLLLDEFFVKNYPKSLDVCHFRDLISKIEQLAHKDALATITYFTARSIIESFKLLPKLPKKILICGGGAKNSCLIRYLQELIDEIYQGKNLLKVENVSTLNDVDPDFIESQGFAYLAARKVQNLPSSFLGTTGVMKPNICGVLVQAPR